MTGIAGLPSGAEGAGSGRNGDGSLVPGGMGVFGVPLRIWTGVKRFAKLLQSLKTDSGPSL